MSQENVIGAAADIGCPGRNDGRSWRTADAHSGPTTVRFDVIKAKTPS
jgi:hypothetical protein